MDVVLTSMMFSFEATIDSSCVRLTSRLNAAMASEITEPKLKQQVSEMDEPVTKLESAATKSNYEFPTQEMSEADVRCSPCKTPSPH